LVIQVFSPFRTQSPSRRARVSMPAGFDPKPGSVSRSSRSLRPIAASAASAASAPRCRRSGSDTSPARPARSRSCAAGIAALELLHDQAVLDVAHAGAAVAFQIRAENPSRPISGISSRENAVAEAIADQRQITRSSTNWRAVCRTSSSCSESESIGRYPLAIGYLTIFWPSFVEFDGMVFPEEEVDEKAVSSWLGSTKGNKQTVEASLNHFHILHLQHPGIWRDATEAQIKFIGQTLKETWAAKLARDFPGRQFVVELIEGTSEKLEDYQVVFYQPKSTSG
jgi:hypothetical protein